MCEIATMVQNCQVVEELECGPAARQAATRPAGRPDKHPPDDVCMSP